MRNVILLLRVFITAILIVLTTCINVGAQTLWGTSSAGGSKNGGGNIFSLHTDGTNFGERYAFLADGANPEGQRLLNYGDGYLYGVVNTTAYGGSGVLYKMLPDGTSYQIVYNFIGVTPSSGVIKGPDGFLYGTSELGGYNNYGGIYKISTAGTGYQVLHNFSKTDGSNPSNELICSGSVLYGTTPSGGTYNNGVAFKMNTDGTAFTVMHHFAGAEGINPNGAFSLVSSRAGIVLYGTANAGGAYGKGAIYSIAVSGYTYQLLCSFSGSGGANPSGGMAQVVPGVRYYGTTTNGGINNTGIVFCFTTASNTLQILHNFPAATGTNEAYPVGAVLDINEVIYGETRQGGSASCGVLFSLGEDATNYQVVHSFTDPMGSFGSLSYISNQLYGLTGGGYINNDLSVGTIYRVNTDGSSFLQLHHFNSTNGYAPPGSLIKGSDGNLYGLTTYGGSGYSDGVAFSIKTDGTGYTPLQWTDKAPSEGQPKGSLIQATDGNFYGLNQYSNPVNFAGSVFKLTVTPNPGIQQYYPFCHDAGCGSYPLGSLLQASDGFLYGTTSSSGTSGTYGTLFKIKPDGTSYSVMDMFPAGGFPSGSLIQAPDGYLYGMTQDGGANSIGTIFKVHTDGTAMQNIYQFGSGGSGLYGLQPAGSLLRGMDGKLYGMTFRGGSYSYGAIFRINTDGTGFQVIYNFNSTYGAYPVASLIQDAGTGILYGMANQGGTYNMGTVFKLNPDGTGFVKLLDFNGSNGKYPKGDLLLLPAGSPLKVANATAIGETKPAEEDNTIQVDIAPNPVHNTFILHFKKPLAEKLYYSLTDMNGKTIQQNTFQSAAGEYFQQINITGLSAGIYILKAGIGDRQFIKKIVKQ
jgi:uncharacterized repeat protein (TIGR03803 family)